jgi:hypothetical protein
VSHRKRLRRERAPRASIRGELRSSLHYSCATLRRWAPSVGWSLSERPYLWLVEWRQRPGRSRLLVSGRQGIKKLRRDCVIRNRTAIRLERLRCQGLFDASDARRGAELDCHAWAVLIPDCRRANSTTFLGPRTVYLCY